LSGSVFLETRELRSLRRDWGAAAELLGDDVGLLDLTDLIDAYTAAAEEGTDAFVTELERAHATDPATSAAKRAEVAALYRQIARQPLAG
jgi:hypothetical protein